MADPKPRTHLAIDPRLCGRLVSLDAGAARVDLTTSAEMAADEAGLLHGGFVFGLADYAAMLAVNHPNVVLGAAEVRFLMPVRVGETLRAEARLEPQEGTTRKQRVRVSVFRAEEEVFHGVFTCFVLERHVLAPRGAANPGGARP